MKKIPTLFKREFEGHNIVNIYPEVYTGMEWVLKGRGFATVKWDGSCCAIIKGCLYKRYDAKNGKAVPEGAIECCKADPVTGHHPYWVPVLESNPADKWFVEASNYNEFRKQFSSNNVYATFEAIGPHFQGNPYHLTQDALIRHGIDVVDVDRSYEGIRQYLKDHYIEGLVFWKDGEPQCKIKRSDFGFDWNKEK